MDSAQQKKILPRDKFAGVFGALKTSSYSDPPVRTSASQTHRTISWNATGSHIATGSTDRTVRVWNPDRTAPKSQIEFKGHGMAVEKVLFNPVKESELASCSGDGTVRFWDIRSRTCTTKLETGGDPFTLSWSIDGTVLVAGTKKDELIVIDTTSTPIILSRYPQTQQTNQTTFSNAHPPQDLLVTTGSGTVKILDYPSMSVLHTILAHTSACTTLSYSPRGTYLAVGGSDALLSLWDTTDWICRRTISSDSRGAIRNLSWSFDGRYLVASSEEVASGGGGGAGAAGIEIYHAETGDVVHTLATGSAPIPAVEWHPGRYWLAYTMIDEKTNKCGLHIVGPGSANGLV